MNRFPCASQGLRVSASLRSGIAVGVLMLLGAMACPRARADISSDLPLMEDGFEHGAGASIHGRGGWSDPWSLFRVQALTAAHAGQGHVRVDTTEFADYDLPGFRFRWGGWIAFAQGALGFTPATGERSVLTIRGFVRISMPLHAHLRGVRVGLLADDAQYSTVADIGMDWTGALDGMVQVGGGEVVWRTPGAVAVPGTWNELQIRLDLTSGLGRLEWNGHEVIVFSHNAESIGGIRLLVDGRPSDMVPFRTQGSGEFDSVSVNASWHCEGDLNLDRVVDDADFGAFIRMYDVGECGKNSLWDASCAADFNRDGVVDEADFTMFAARYDTFVCP